MENLILSWNDEIVVRKTWDCKDAGDSSCGSTGDHMIMDKQGKFCVLCSIKSMTI
jgi:hypothetical protein